MLEIGKRGYVVWCDRDREEGEEKEGMEELQVK